MTSASNLGRHLVPGTDEAFYIPDFVSQEEEGFLMRKVLESPLPKWKQLTNRRLQIWGGSMTTKGVLIPEELPSFVKTHPDIIARIKATGAFESSPHGAPNHIIMNEYLPGQGIMPHEDGPAYHPIVATLTLGSHTLFHYYHYEPSGAANSSEARDQGASEGRVIDPDPVLSVLLEPRSLIITRSALYENHLHGIDGVVEDEFEFRAPDGGGQGSTGPLRVANLDMLTDASLREVVSNGGVLRRGARYSLTCRDVARVASGLPILKR